MKMSEHMKIVYLIAIIFVAAACNKAEEKKEVVVDVPQVQLIHAQSLQPSLDVKLPGELKPWNKAHLFPRVKGYVQSVRSDRGTQVKKGQVLAVLEAPELHSTLNQAKAQLSSAEAALIEQRAKMRASTLTFRRLIETSKTAGAVSANELDMAKARMESDSALSAAGSENLRAAEAHMNSQSQFVQYLTVTAPFDGVITERNISPGDLVGPDGNAKAMFILEDRSKLRLTIAVPENLANSVRDGSAVTFYVEADPEHLYKAAYGRSSNTLTESNRTMMAEFDYDNTAGDLKAGMYAEVKMPVTRNKASLFVPTTSLIHSTEGVYVVRVREQIAEWVLVKKGNKLDTLTEVFGPIETDDDLVLKAYDELRNGVKVAGK
jgi:RND family efflux transporter MFP subunit